MLFIARGKVTTILREPSLRPLASIVMKPGRRSQLSRAGGFSVRIDEGEGIRIRQESGRE